MSLIIRPPLIVYGGCALSGRDTSIRHLLGEEGYAESKQPIDGWLVKFANARVVKWRRGSRYVSLAEHARTAEGSAEVATLRCVSGIVFVIDSQRAMLSVNAAALESLRKDLSEIGVDWETVPFVFQLNKRDLPDIVPADELIRRFGSASDAFVETVATQGSGVARAFESATHAARS